MFNRGGLYSRAEVAAMIDYPLEKRDGGAWMTGMTEFNNAFYVFANLGIPGRTGHDYQNHWSGTDLVVSTRSNAKRGQPQLERVLSGSYPVYIFWRASRDPRFTYAGEGQPSNVSGTEPPVITWSLNVASETCSETSEPPSPHGVLWRGPIPTIGPRSVIVTNVSDILYLAILQGLVDQPFVQVKIGVTCDTDRRLRELNWALPEMTGLKWSLFSARRYEDARLAYATETRLLEGIRLKEWPSAGEFCAIPQLEFAKFVDLFGEIEPGRVANTPSPV